MRLGLSMYVIIVTNLSFLTFSCNSPTDSDSNLTLKDIDGNTYKIIKIGDQLWMADNLKVTHYRNGDAIPNVTDDAEWRNLNTGAYCSYDNSVSNVSTYGLLYNWYAVNDSRIIAPEGWHVSTDEEWKELELYLGMRQDDVNGSGYRETDAGGKLKSKGTKYWRSPNEGATNESGFSALPGGVRYGDFGFKEIGNHAYFFAFTEQDDYKTWYRSLQYGHSGIVRLFGTEDTGRSIRCVRD